MRIDRRGRTIAENDLEVRDSRLYLHVRLHASLSKESLEVNGSRPGIDVPFGVGVARFLLLQLVRQGVSLPIVGGTDQERRCQRNTETDTRLGTDIRVVVNCPEWNVETGCHQDLAPSVGIEGYDQRRGQNRNHQQDAAPRTHRFTFGRAKNARSFKRMRCSREEMQAVV